MKTDFERDAHDLRTYLNVHIRHDSETLPRPFIIEIDGPPSSGKSTVVRKLTSTFRRAGLRVFRPQEAPEAIRHIEHGAALLYNLRTGIYSLTHLLDQQAGHQYDIVFLERGPFDVCNWMEYWKKRGRVSLQEVAVITQFFLLPAFTDHIDCAIFLVCDAHTAIARERIDLEVDEPSPYSKPEMIDEHNDQYRSLFESLSSQYPQLRLVDGTNLSKRETEERLRHMILQTMKERIKRSLARVSAQDRKVRSA